jgi:hypothetical protein
MKEAIEQVPVKFWDYSSDKVTIDEAKLYDYLHKKGYRYYETSVKDQKYIVLVTDNSISALLWNVYKISSSLVDKDFSSLSEDERIRVKEVLKEVKDTLKKRRLAHISFKDLDSIKDSASKQFLMKLNK